MSQIKLAMNELIKQIRSLYAERLLRLAYRILPNSEEKILFSLFLLSYIKLVKKNVPRKSN